MKFTFIAAKKAEFPVSVLCQVLGVSRSGFYAWLARPASIRKQDDEALGASILEIHRKSRDTYGAPRVHAELRANEVRVGKKRVARLMADQGLKARRKRRFKPTTTQVDVRLPVVENLLARNFTHAAPNVAWVADTSFIETEEGWLYLAVLLDLHSRKAVGWAMSEVNDGRLVLSALAMAVRNRRPEPGLLHHSDRGTQYASVNYRKALERHGMVCSMSRSGNCWDNAVAESFFGTLKAELVNGAYFETRREAKNAIFEYIEVFYNRQRRHSRLSYLSPENFENLTA